MIDVDVRRTLLIGHFGSIQAGGVEMADEMIVDLPVIANLRDLIVAIPVADEHPEIRWYVEKRRAALNSEVMLPWD